MKIAAITEDDVVSYAKQALNSKRTGDLSAIIDMRYRKNQQNI